MLDNTSDYKRISRLLDRVVRCETALKLTAIGKVHG